MTDYVSVKQFAKDNNLKLLAGQEGLNAKISEDMILRPGLEFAGFFDFYDKNRIVLVGSKDHSFLKQEISEDQKRKNVERIFASSIPPWTSVI